MEAWPMEAKGISPVYKLAQVLTGQGQLGTAVSQRVRFHLQQTYNAWADLVRDMWPLVLDPVESCRV